MAKDRKKASDIFKESIPLAGKKGSIDEIYPEIINVIVRVEEVGHGVQNRGTRTYTKGQFGKYIDCHNPICYGGGFSIGSILGEMVRNRQTHYEGTKTCMGFEGSPMGKRRYRSCINRFRVEVEIEYKDEKEVPIRQVRKSD